MRPTTLFLTIVLALILAAAPAAAGTKFKNRDTADDRQDVQFGTDNEDTDIKIDSGKKSNTISVKSKKKDKNDQGTNIGTILVVPEVKP